MTGHSFEEITKSTPERSLLVIKKRSGGRNALGRVTVRHRGGGARRYIRVVDFKREKHGIPVYLTNPSVPDATEIAKAKRVQIGDTHKGFVVDNGTGEILGRGAAFAYEFEEVDKERFVKLYLAGLKQASGLIESYGSLV